MLNYSVAELRLNKKVIRKVKNTNVFLLVPFLLCNVLFAKHLCLLFHCANITSFDFVAKLL